jgi:hypothetical protein
MNGRIWSGFGSSESHRVKGDFVSGKAANDPNIAEAVIWGPIRAWLFRSSQSARLCPATLSLGSRNCRACGARGRSSPSARTRPPSAKTMRPATLVQYCIRRLYAVWSILTTCRFFSSGAQAGAEEPREQLGGRNRWAWLARSPQRAGLIFRRSIWDELFYTDSPRPSSLWIEAVLGDARSRHRSRETLLGVKETPNRPQDLNDAL